MNRIRAISIIYLFSILITACALPTSKIIASIKTDEWETKVLSVERVPISVGGVGELETPILLDVTFEIKNLGSEATTVTASDFVVIDSQGTEYTDPVLGGKGGLGGSEGVIFQLANPGEEIDPIILWSPMPYGLPAASFEVKPGERVEKTYRFVVPGDSAKLELKFKDLPAIEIISSD